MRNLSNEFKNRKIDYSKLLKYGFIKMDNNFIYEKEINNDFKVIISLSDNEQISKVIDLSINEEYFLVDTNTIGEFVGSIKEEYEKIINDVINKCTSKNVFKSKQAKEIIKYISKEYNDNLEYLWEKFPENAIWRNKTNRKWYAALLTVNESKLGLNSNNIIEIIDLRYQREEIENVIDNKLIFPGYHMNKKSWITIKLDETVDTGAITAFIDNSYNLSLGNKDSQSITDLSNKVYNYLTLIPKGKIVTYKQIAEYLGNKGLARVVGNILHNNPDDSKYPCYKVVNSKGELSPAFAFGGKNIQKELLENDGIIVDNEKVDLSIYQWKK